MIAKIQTFFSAKRPLTEKLCRGKNSNVKTIDSVKSHKTFCAFKDLGLAPRKVGQVLWCLTSPGFFCARRQLGEI